MMDANQGSTTFWVIVFVVSFFGFIAAASALTVRVLTYDMQTRIDSLESRLDDLSK